MTWDARLWKHGACPHLCGSGSTKESGLCEAAVAEFLRLTWVVVGGSCKPMYAESLSALPRVIFSLSLSGRMSGDLSRRDCV